MQAQQMSASLRTSVMSLVSQIDFDLRQVFTTVGTYKDTLVAIKRVRKRHVDLTRNIRKELKIVSNRLIMLLREHFVSLIQRIQFLLTNQSIEAW